MNNNETKTIKSNETNQDFKSIKALIDDYVKELNKNTINEKILKIKERLNNKMKFKKILKNTTENIKYIKSLPSIYGVFLWAHYGVNKYPLAYYRRNKNNEMIPYVYCYNDHQCTVDQYELLPIDNTTTGNIIIWTLYKATAERIANSLEAYMNKLIYKANTKINKDL